jgi:hypothetical protein
MEDFSSDEIQDLIEQLNPDYQQHTGKDYDANWDKLRRERTDPFAAVVKTKSPTLLQHPKNYSFVYRRYDGAHWHTELRSIDTEQRKVALTGEQKRLKDNIDTIWMYTNAPNKLVWHTPIDQSTDQYDPRYQLITIGAAWYCCIDNKIYETSNNRQPPNKAYQELTFSTAKPCVFSIQSTEAILDRILK